jgi:RHS repeat-associated protein
LEQVATTGGSTTTTTYYYADSMRIAVAVNGAVSYLASDGLGSANVAIKSADSSTSATLFAPYGSARYSSGTMPTDYGFTGQHADSMTGLDYYNARYYDPLAGQFTSADSVLERGGYEVWALSRYAYVQGNPEVRTDPSGHGIDNGPDKDILPQHVQTAAQAARNSLESLKEKLAEMEIDREHLRTDKSKKEELRRHVNAIKRIKARFSGRIDELRKIGVKIPKAAELADQIEAEGVDPMKFDPVTEYSLTEFSEPEARPAEPEGGRAPEAGGPRPEPGGGGRGLGGGLGGENVLKE